MFDEFVTYEDELEIRKVVVHKVHHIFIRVIENFDEEVFVARLGIGLVRNALESVTLLRYFFQFDIEDVGCFNDQFKDLFQIH